jgi:hypothetical protein
MDRDSLVEDRLRLVLLPDLDEAPSSSPSGPLHDVVDDHFVWINRHFSAKVLVHMMNGI